MIRKIKPYTTCICCGQNNEVDRFGDYDCICGHEGNLTDDNEIYNTLALIRCPICMEYSLDPVGDNGWCSCYRCSYKGKISFLMSPVEEFSDLECNNCGMLIRDCKLTKQWLYTCALCGYKGDLQQETKDSEMDWGIDDEAFDKYG